MTIKSSMFRWLKIFRASIASACSPMQIGWRVITAASGLESAASPSRDICRRKSPSVKTPDNLPRLLTTLTLPDLACVMTSNASLTVTPSPATALRSPVRMICEILNNSARPMAPEGWCRA